MSQGSVGQMRTIIAGAAHGAWIAVLIGVIAVVVGWALAMCLFTYAPELMSTVTGAPVEQVWSLTLRTMAGMKLLLLGWVLIAVFLSYWWRSLREPQ